VAGSVIAADAIPTATRTTKNNNPKLTRLFIMLKDVMVQPIQKVTMSHVYLGLRASEPSAQQRSGVISGFNLARRIGAAAKLG